MAISYSDTFANPHQFYCNPSSLYQLPIQSERWILHTYLNLATPERVIVVIVRFGRGRRERDGRRQDQKELHVDDRTSVQ